MITAKIEVKFDYTDSVIASLDGESLMPSAMQAGTLVIQNYARMYVPVDTAALKNSIRTERDKTTRTGAYVNVGSDLVYARIQELGGVIKPKRAKMLSWTGKDGKFHTAHAVTLKAQPYMRPAADNHKPEILSVVKEVTRRIISGAMR